MNMHKNSGVSSGSYEPQSMMLESLEERRMMTGLVYSVNIVGVSAPTRPTPAETYVVAKPTTGFFPATDDGSR